MLALLVLAALPVAGARANPLIEGDRPDPTVLRFDGRFYAASTTSYWAPLFPIVRSDDLVNWTEIGAVLRSPPPWGAGRFWAPELTRGPGGDEAVLAYWSSSSRDGRPCIGVASAPRPEGPWRDRGRVACPAGGAIDAAPVVDGDGRRLLAYKALGVGGGIHLRRLTADGLRARGPSRLLIRPDEGWERGVTEGPAFLHRDGWWYLLYSGGTCCRPPCTYAEGVARARRIEGPYTKLGAPIMTGDGAFICPGHGTPLVLPDGRTFLLHHAYRADDTGALRRLMLLDEITWPGDGWPHIGGPAAATPSPFGAVQAPLAEGWSDGFAGRSLGPAWQWPWNRPPRAAVGGGALRIRCAARPSAPEFVARQAAPDRLAAVGDLRPAPGATAFLAVHDHAGALRGIARRADGATFAFRVTLAGRVARGPLHRGLGRHAIVLAGPDGGVTVEAGGVAIPAGPAGTGAAAIRVAVGCWGSGTAAFTSVRMRPLPPA